MSEIERLRALLAAWDFETYPGPFQVEPRYRRDAWWADNKMGDSIQITPKDVDLIVNALPALLDVVEAARTHADVTHVSGMALDGIVALDGLLELRYALRRLDGAS